MKNLILLKPYQHYQIGDVISVTSSIANTLVSSGIANFHVKTINTKFGETKALEFQN